MVASAANGLISHLVEPRGDEGATPEPGAHPPRAPRARTHGRLRTHGRGPAGALEPSWLTTRESFALPHVAVETRSRPVHRCGGDLCLVYPLGEAALIVVGDVSGHDYDAALACALARGACDVAVREVRPLGAVRLLEILDRALRAAAHGRIAMSCAVALVASRTMTVASAGHPLPYLVRDGGRTIDGVRCFGGLLGAGPGATFQTATVALRPGDRVLWYTDGVLDTEDEGGQRFGHRRLRGLLARRGGAGAAELADALAAELFWFRGDAPDQDDATFAVAELR